MTDIDFVFRPLDAWPHPPTPADARKQYPFMRSVTRSTGVGTSTTERHRMGLEDTYQDLARELKHLSAKEPVVIRAFFREKDIRRDNGLPRADAPQPKQPGVILQFDGLPKGAKQYIPFSFACDDCARWQDNLRAIALTLERLRLAELYGVIRTGEQYRGFAALPGPGQSLVTPPPAMSVEEAARFLSAEAGEAHRGTVALREKEAFADLYRNAAKRLHPDGSEPDPDKWRQLEAAKAVLEAHHAR